MRAMRGGLLALVLGACAPMQQIEKIGEVTPPTMPAFAATPSVVYQRSIVKYDAGAPIFTVMAGLACIPSALAGPTVTQRIITDSEIEAIFQREFRAAGFRVADTVGDGSLFADKKDIAADLRIAGIVTAIKANICYPMGGFGDFYNGHGEASLRVEWQIYSDARKAVIYTTMQPGYGRIDSNMPNASLEVLRRAFGRAVRGLLADEGFRAVATTALPVSGKSGS